MLPYIDVPPLHVGGWLTLQPFDALVAMGCLVGYFVGRWHVRQVGLGPDEYRRLTMWILIAAFLGSYWVSLVVYYTEHIVNILKQPWRLLDVGATMSSYGGFIGAAIGAWLYWRRSQAPRWPYADAMVLAWLVGWCFGRLGCTIVHDHPGVPSTFLLAVQFPDGPRHDLGLYEWLYTIVLTVLIFSLRNKSLPPGTLIGIVCVCYAPMRLLLDNLRIGDQRYLGWTPAQYFSIVLLLIGVWVLVSRWRIGSSNAFFHRVVL